MMSTQPSTPSNLNNLDHRKWDELGELTDQLLGQSDLESLISYVIYSFESIFTCTARLWFTEAIHNQIGKEVSQRCNIHLSKLTDLMMEAYKTKLPAPELNSDSIAPNIALPLIIRNEVWGILQLEREKQNGFNNQDLILIRGYSLLVTVALENKIKLLIQSEQGKKYEMILSATKFILSITSDLDLENLLNSIVTYLHQTFGFSKVSVYTIFTEEYDALKKVCVSKAGLEPPNVFYFKQFNGPVSWSIAHQESVIINNTDGVKRFPASYFDVNCKSEFVVPLFSGNNFIGIVDLCSDQINAFNSKEVENLILLCESIAISIRNVQFLHTEKLMAQVTEHLQAVLGMISAKTSYDDLLYKILDELDKIIPADASAIWLFDNEISDNENDQLTSSFRIGSIKFSDQLSLDSSEKLTLINSEMKNQLPIYGDDPKKLLAEFPWLLEIIKSTLPKIEKSASPIEPLGKLFSLSDYSLLGIPLNHNGQSLGLIISVYHLADHFTEESRLLATTFSKYVSVALENTRLFSATHEQLWMTTVQQQVIEATRSINSITELIETIIKLLVELVGIKGCSLYLYDKSHRVFSPQASYGFDEEQQARLNSFDIFPGTVIAFDTLIESRSQVGLNAQTVSDEIASLIFPTYDLQSNLLTLIPLISQDNLTGAMLIDFSNTELEDNISQKHWDDMLVMIQGISQHAAVSIENLQILKSQEEEAYISVALLQVAQAIVSLNQLDEILGAIVRITPILVGVKRCIIYLCDKTYMVFHPTQYFGFSKSEIDLDDHMIESNNFPLLNTIFYHNQVVYHQMEVTNSPLNWKNIKKSDLNTLEGIALENDEIYSYKLDDQVLYGKARLLIGFPLSIKDEVLGIMLIEEEEPVKGLPSHHIREKRIEIVKGITQQAALAIKNELLQIDYIKNERMEQELLLAREIQRTFLPDHLPTIPGWDMDVRWKPARQVAGDFYDIIHLEGNKLGLVIADVADKGMPAALFMTLIRTLIRSTAKDHVSPAAVLQHVNELLVPDAKNGMFVTVFYAVIDLGDGTITYANAGHNPPIVRHLNSVDLIELSRTSVALGIYDDIKVDEGKVFLETGDWLFLYTDGITEAFSINDEMYGTKRLYELLLNKKYSSSIEMLDIIENSVYEFINGGDLSDDMTIAVIINNITR